MATGSALRDLSIHVALNDTEIKSGLTSLTRLIKASTNSWKADMLTFENSGDHLNALKAKFEGLGDSIDAQKQSIQRLVEEQNTMGQRTQKNASEWDEYTVKISRANKSLASMTQQQLRTSDAIKFENTGIRSLRNSYDAMHEQIESSISIYKKQGNQITATREQMVGYRKEVVSLQEIEKRESAVLGEVKQKFGAQSDEYRQQETRVNKLKSTIASYSVTASKSFKTIGNATKQDTLAIDRVNARYSKLSTTSQKLRGAGSSLLSTTLSVGAGFIYSAKQAGTLQDSYIKTNNLLVTGGEKASRTTKAVNEMQKDGEQYAIKYGKSMTSIAGGYQELIKRGYSSSQALGSMKSILQASVASGDDYNDVVKVTTSTLESFGMRVKSTSGMMKNTKTVTNELAYAADMSATSFKDIGTAMEYVGPTAKQAHVSLSETSAILGVLSNNGLEAQKAGTGVRKIMTSLLSPTKAASNILEQYKIKIKDSNGNMLNMTTIFGELNKAFTGMGSAQKTDLFHKIFGTTGQNAAALLADNADKVDALNKKIKQAPNNNYVESLSGKNMKSAQNQLNIFKQSATALGVEFAKELLPEVTKFTQAAVPMVRQLTNASDGTKKLVVAGVAAVALAGPLMSLTGVIGTIASGVLKVDAAYKTFSAKHRAATTDSEENTAATKEEAAAKKELADATIAETKAQAENNAVQGNAPTGTSLSSTKDVAKTGGTSDVAVAERTSKNASVTLKNAELASRGAVTSTSTGSKILSSLKGMSWLDKGMVGLTFADAGVDAVKSIQDGVSSKKGGAEMWTSGGKAVGAGLGLVLGGGDPLTGMIGSAVGGAIGKGLASSKSVKEISAGISKANDKNKPKTAAEKADLKTAIKVATGDTGAQYTGINYSKSVDNMNKAFETSTEKAYKTLPKTVQNANDSITKGLVHANAKFATGLASDTSASTKNIKAINSSTYSSIEKTLSSYTSKQTSASKKRLDEMVKAGAMTKKQENTILKNENSSYNTRLNNAKKSLNSLSGIEVNAQQKMANQNKKYNSQVSTLEKQKNAAILSLEKGGTAKLNGEVVQGKTWEKEITESYNKKINAVEKSNQKARTKITSDAIKARYKAEFRAEAEVDDVISSGSTKQKSILRKANADTGGLSKKQADKMISESNRSMNKVVKDAKSTYSKTKKSANDKYKATTAAAKKEFETNPDFSEKQYKAVMKSAKAQKKAAIDAAYDQMNTTIDYAQREHTGVVKAIKAARTGSETQISKLEKYITGHDPFKVLGDDASHALEKVTGLTDGFATLEDAAAKANKAANKASTAKANQGKDMTNRVSGNLHQPVSNVFGHATGGAIHRTATSLVGEAGPELAYDPKKSTARILGAKGAELTTVHAGEYILNAKDTKKAMRGGVGTTLKGYANGTVKMGTLSSGTNVSRYASGTTADDKKLSKSLKKSSKDLSSFSKKSKKTWKKTDQDTDNATKSMSKKVKKQYSKLTDNAKSTLNSYRKWNNKNWDSVYSDTKSSSNSIYKYGTKRTKDLQSSLKSTQSGIKKTWKKDWGDMSSSFNHEFGKLHGYSKGGMNKAITSLNGGTKNINKLISKFGGNDSVLPSISHYATGTMGAIPHNELAMINDGLGNDWKEIVQMPSGHMIEANKKNAIMPLPAGSRVMNGEQSKYLKDQGIVAHASGTVSDDQLNDLIKKNLKHPSKAYKNDFTDEVSDVKSPDIGQSMLQTAKGASKSQGQKWYKTVWQVLNDAANGDGSSSELLSAVEKYGKGKKYVWGAAGPNEFDCSGLVMYALEHSFGISYPHFSGAQYSKSTPISKSDAKSGDLVFWGPGDHVGVYAGGSQYYSAFSPSANPNIGMYPLSGSVPGKTPMFARVKGLKQNDSKKDSSDSKLTSLVKSELGKKALNWVSDNLAPKVSGTAAGDNVKPTGSHKHWMEQAEIPSSWFDIFNTIINAESHWNPKAQNPTSPAYGIPQALPGSKMASAGSDWRTNPITQLKWMKGYVKGRYGTAQKALAFRNANNWYANGGIVQNEQIAKIGEGGLPEAVIPLDSSKRSRGNELLGQVATMFAKDNNHTSGGTGDSTGIEQKLDTLIDMMSQFMQLVQAKPTGITAQQVYAANKQQAAIQTNKYNRSLGLR
ncbi:phage tail tape measure protein [Pediococcus inopinatus]|uniref:phage tail tape measure protein n=1 Tax=Pediococcus inopinatus TaxID=114090 RepID=UPI002B25E974|nr:phage tail tape measure protein [Pediococcus inopinatus]WPC19419.1 phage tail tape measure protein [Pediococcus inopinatus]